MLKIGKYGLRPTLNLQMRKENLCPNLSFTVDKKNWEFTQGFSHFKLNLMIEIFHSLIF